MKAQFRGQKQKILPRKSNTIVLVKFHGKSNGVSLDALKRCLDPEMAHKGLIGDRNKKSNSELE